MVDPVTAIVGAWVGEWATVAIAAKIVQGVGAKLNADEVSCALKEATRTASDEHRLFYRCLPKGVEKSLEHFFQGKGLAELQKPLNDLGAPDVTFLVKAFEQSADQHPEKIQIEYLRPWMEVFVRVYFARTNCFIGLQVAKDDYLKQLVNRFDDVKFAGIATPGDERSKKAIALEQIFVMLKVREEGRSGFGEIDLELPKEMGRQGLLLAEQRSRLRLERTAPAISAERFLVEQKRSVILGAPGSGKTTLMSYFAVRLAQGQEDRLPILIRIRDWALQPQMSLLDYLRYFAEKRLQTKTLPVGFFEHWLDAGKALILLDGLDEVADEAKRYALVEQIECFLGQDRNVRNPAIITSRPAGYRRDFLKTAEFPHHELLAFDDGQMQEFVDRWYESREPDPVEREQRKQSLQKAFEGSERIKLLASNPLLLTIMVLIHRDQAILPKRRHELYDSAVKTLLLSWNANKVSIDTSNANNELTYPSKLKYLQLDDLRRLMEQVAYWIHTQASTGDAEGGTLIDRDELIRQLSRDIKALKSIDLYQAKAEAERFLDFIRERTGLMNEQGEDCYAFVHKTFQEYLCAQEIMYQTENEEEPEITLQHVKEHLHDQHWREVLLLLIGQQLPKRAAKIIQRIIGQSSEYEQWLHRDLLFAATCLTENIKGLNSAAPDLLHLVLDGLVRLELSDYRRVGEQVRDAAQRILLDFSETEFEFFTLQALNNHKDYFDKKRFQAFQVALGERDFVITALLELLTDTEPSVSHRAASALGNLGDRSNWVVTALLESLTAIQPFVRSNAASVLGDLGDRSDYVITALLKLLADTESFVRFSAAYALIKLGDRSDRAITALLKLLTDTEPSVCDGAASVLGSLGDRSDRIIIALLGLTTSPQSFVRSSAASALGDLGDHSDRVIVALLKLLTDTEPSVSYKAASALSNLGYSNDHIITALLGLMTDTHAWVRSSAASTLGGLGNSSDRVIVALLELLTDIEPSVLASAAYVLGNLDDHSDRVITALLELMTDTDLDVRFSAASALVKLGDRSNQVVMTLLELLTNTEAWVRSSASSALGNLGDCSDQIITALLKLLTETESPVPYDAAPALSKLGKRSPEILPRIIQWIEAHENSDNAGAGIDVLWAIVVE